MSKSQSRNPEKSAPLGCTFAALTLSLLLTVSGFAQVAAPQPRQDQLLNGLKILFLNRPGDKDVYLKLRIHSGAAFDLAGKEGLMALLGDAMFDAETRRFVEEDLEGRLEFTTDYDSLNITLAARASDFNRLLELLRNSIINMRITPEDLEQLKAARAGDLKSSESAPADVADSAVAARLFDPHPYGRVVAGTPGSIARIEYGDLLLMRERFLSPNNSTLVIIGNLDHRRTMRALRQALGGWRMSDRIVPNTFRQPEAPDSRVLVVDHKDAEGYEIRLSVRGLARTDRDRPAALVLAELARTRWLAADPSNTDSRVRHRAFHDGGSFVMSASVKTAADASEAIESARAVLKGLTAAPPSPDELAKAKSRVTSELNEGAQGLDGLAVSWLDAHTYATGATTGETTSAINALSTIDIERVADRLFLHTPSAVVAVGDAAKLGEELARLGGIELQGETQAVENKKKTEAAAPTESKKNEKPPLRLKRPRR